MLVKAEDLKSVLNDLAQKNVINKMPLAGDMRNPLRVFLLSVFVGDKLPRLVDSMAVDGVVSVPDEAVCTAAIDKSGGTLPFPVDLPMGLGFTLRFNKQDLSDFYSAVKRYEVTP